MTNESNIFPVSCVSVFAPQLFHFPPQIAKILNADGVPIPSDYRAQRLGKPNPYKNTLHYWNHVAVRNILIHAKITFFFKRLDLCDRLLILSIVGIFALDCCFCCLVRNNQITEDDLREPVLSRFSVSAVRMSAICLNILINSGRPVQLAIRVRSLKPLPAGFNSQSVFWSPKTAAAQNGRTEFK